MPQKPKIFKKGDKLYDVPSNEVTDFLNEVPDAVEINVYEKDGKTFDVPLTDLDAFMQEVPGATLLEGSKKKVSTPAGGPGRGSFGLGSTPESLSQVTKILKDNKDKNFVKRILDQNTIAPLDRGDGVSSSHSMAWGEADGKYYVYPTVVEQDGKLVDIKDKDPLGYALKNNEYIQFDTKEEAAKFSSDDGYKQYWNPTQELSPLPTSVGESIIAGEPEKDPILKRLSEKNNWFAAPINFLTGAVRGTGEHIMKPLDGAQRLFYKGVGSLMELSKNPTIMAEGMKLKKQQDDPNHGTWFKNAQWGIDNFATDKLPEPMKGDFFSALVYNLGELAPFMGTLAVTPNPSLFGVGTKLPINIAGQSAMSTYADTGDLAESVKAGAIGLGDGALLMMMGYGAGKSGQWITKNLKNTLGPAAGITGTTAGAGMMYGGGVSNSVSKQLLEGVGWENLDWDAANEEGALFFALGVPGIVNAAASTYLKAPKESIALARRAEVDINVAREKAFELFEKAEKETDPAKKTEYHQAAEAMNRLTDIKAMEEYFGKNAEQARKDIQESELSEADKRAFLERIDEAELHQQQIKESEKAREDARGEIGLKIEETEDGKFQVSQEGSAEKPEFATRKEAEAFKEKFETITGMDKGMKFKDKKAQTDKEVASGEKKKPKPKVTPQEPSIKDIAEGKVKSVKTTINDVEVSLNKSGDKSVHIDRFFMPEDGRGKGESFKVLEKLTKQADKDGIELSTTISPDVPTDANYKAMQSFFKKGGFEPEVRDGEIYRNELTRKPKGAKPEDIIAEHEKSGGATFDVSGKNLAGAKKSSVGIFPERTTVVKGELKPEDIAKFKEANKDLLEGNEDVLAIGTWKKAEGEHVLDITALTSREKALELGKEYNQESIYDLETGELIETGGTGAPVEGMKPEIDRVGDLKDRTGKQNEAFFTEKAEKASSDVPYEPVIKIDKETPTAKAYETYSAGGNFTGHISKMIPGFQEKQVRVAEAVTKGGAKSFLDIGASEGGLAKTVASQNPEMKAVALDPNSQMKKNFDSTPKVKNAEFKQEAFQGSWTEADGTKINEFKPKEKFDVINEDFTFQFVNNDRATQVSGVKEMLNPDGIFITSEKFTTTNKAANEAKKAEHQKKYFTAEERTADAEGIVTGMEKDMVKDTDYYNTLKDNFTYVEEFWNAGEFKGFAASDSKASLDSFKKNVGDLTTEFSDPTSQTATPKAGGPPDKVPPKPPKPPEEPKELPEPDKEPERDVMEVLSEMKKEREKAMKKRKSGRVWKLPYFLWDQQEPFKRQVQKGAKLAGKGDAAAQKVLDRKNVEKGSKARTAMDFSKAMKDVTGGIRGFGPKEMELISDINDMRRTAELYKSREAMGKKEILMEGGISLKQAEDFLTKVRKKDPAILEQYGLKDYDPKKVREASDKFNEKYRDILDELLAEGLIRKEAYDAIVFEHPYYSPRKFIQSMDKMDPGGSMSGVESLKGGSEGAKIVDAPSLYFDALSRKNAMVARARTFRAMEDYVRETDPWFMEQAEYAPEFLEKMSKAEQGDPWIEPKFKDTPKGMEAVDYLDANGNRKRFHMDAEVHKYFDIEPFGDLSRKIMNYAGWISGTKPLKMAATGYNPEFMVKNIPIDMMHILNTTDVYSGALPVAYAQMSLDMARVAKDVATRSGTYTDYINEGGGMKMLTGEGRLREGISRRKLQKATQIGEAIEGLASWLGESSELITRLSLRWRHLENAKSRFTKENGREPTPKEVKEMQLDATAYARNYLDFEQGGRLIKMADSVIPYLNAGFQVTRGSLRAAGKNPGLYAAKVAQLAGVASAITAWNMGKVQTKNIDEEKGAEMQRFYLNDISDEVKARNFVVMTPLKYTDVNGVEKYLYFKLQKDNAQELITGVAEDRVHREIMGDNAPSYLSSRRLKELQVMTESATNVSQLPPAIRGALGYKLNKDFFYNSELWMGYDMGKDKSKEYRRDTPERYKAIGKIPLPGGHQLSPTRSHYMAKQFFTESNVIATGVGEVFDEIIRRGAPDMATEYTPGEVEKLKNAPFARRFLKSTYPGASKQGSDTHQQVYNRLKQGHNQKLESLMDAESSSEAVYEWLESIVEDGDGDITSIKEFERLERRYTEEVLMPAVNSWVERLKYVDAVPRAQDLFDQWVHMNDDLRDHLLESAAMAGVLSDDTVAKFSELMEEYEAEKEKMDSENNEAPAPEGRPKPKRRKRMGATPELPGVKDVRGKDVTMEVEIEETGEKTTMELSAVDVRRDIQRRYDAINQLMEAIG